MKKALYLTSALVAASVLALGSTATMAASKAKPMKLGISGSYKAVVGYARQGSGFSVSSGAGTAYTGYNEVDIKTDSEIHFKGSTTTDGGIKVGVGVELEADQATAGIIDGSYMSFGGSFGGIVLGNTGAASAALAVNAPSTGAIGIFGGDSNSWIVKPTAVALSVNAGGNIGGGDQMKVRWISPSFSGFKFGASYVPSLASSNIMGKNGGNGGVDSDQIDAAIQYSGKMGGNAVKLYASYWNDNKPTTATDGGATEGTSMGASATMGAFTFGGSYKEVNSTGTQITTLSSGSGSISGTTLSKDEEASNVGIQWAQGPATLSLNYFLSEMEMATATAGEDLVEKWTLGAKYAMGPGVDFVGSVQNVVWEDELKSAAIDNNKGTAFVGGIAVKF